MRKIFFLLLFIPLLGIGQTITYKVADQVSVSADTSFSWETTKDNVWQIRANYLTGAATSTVMVQTSIDNSAWTTIPTADTLIMSTTSGSKLWEGYYTPWNYMRTLVTAYGTATVTVIYNLKRK